MEHFRVYDTIDSTNKEALRLLDAGGNLHGTVLLAIHQTEGRGQYGRTWVADQGNHLAMSVILQPINMIIADLPLLSMKTSLAVIRAINTITSGLKLSIKWPNDIYVGDQKIAGILIENSISSTKIQHSVIGIGMNVNEKQFPAILPNPTSLFLVTQREFDISTIAKNLREQVMNILDEGIEKWKPEYDELIYRRGTLQEFEWNGNKITGEILGIDAEGRLQLDIGDNARKHYFSHEISWSKR